MKQTLSVVAINHVLTFNALFDEIKVALKFSENNNFSREIKVQLHIQRLPGLVLNTKGKRCKVVLHISRFLGHFPQNVQTLAELCVILAM